MNNTEIREKLIKAVRKFIDKDWEELYKNCVYENTFGHRIAVYLEENFNEYNNEYKIDCEYNKIYTFEKVNNENKKIRPDIIIHKRDSMDCNKLIIEIKKAGIGSVGIMEDIEKLKKCSNLRYNLGAVIGILRNTIDIIFIEYGNEDRIRLDNKGNIIKGK